ncbi:unnamed protein product [Dovyalis caffra]|uniref:Uncharacterized protein n=1 Tax=Dovyalis caffra TaxID=77055 RepID=A0AAV1R3X9_9ROSI|nr:unnamed protein product [Dovyalis caffra]
MEEKERFNTSLQPWVRFKSQKKTGKPNPKPESIERVSRLSTTPCKRNCHLLLANVIATGHSLDARILPNQMHVSYMRHLPAQKFELCSG